MPSNVSEMRLLSKPRITSVPPEEPNGSLLVKLTPGRLLMVSLIDWPGVWRWMNSALSTSRVLLVSGTSTPPTLGAREPVTTIASSSNSTVPDDWAIAVAGKANAEAAQRRRNLFMDGPQKVSSTGCRKESRDMPHFHERVVTVSVDFSGAWKRALNRADSAPRR